MNKDIRLYKFNRGRLEKSGRLKSVDIGNRHRHFFKSIEDVNQHMKLMLLRCDVENKQYVAIEYTTVYNSAQNNTKIIKIY